MQTPHARMDPFLRIIPVDSGVSGGLNVQDAALGNLLVNMAVAAKNASISGSLGIARLGARRYSAQMMARAEWFGLGLPTAASAYRIPRGGPRLPPDMRQRQATARLVIRVCLHEWPELGRRTSYP